MSKPVNKYNPFLFWIITFIMFLFTKIFGIRARLPKEVKNLKPPFLLLSNHIGLFDPFVVGYFLKYRVQFVSSDAPFHTPFMRWFLSNLGVIKKKKNIRDTQMIRDLITVIKRGNSVGLFPEGTRSWTGSSLPIDPSIGKLVKLLNVPVITVKLAGMQLFNPRWFPKVRPTKVEVSYQLTLSSDQVNDLNQDEIVRNILGDLHHDEVDYQYKNMQEIHSLKRAEYINHVLYMCADCHAIGQIRVTGNDFGCKNCGSKIHIDKFGFFASENGEEMMFDNIRDWFNWQKQELRTLVKNGFENKLKSALFYDEKMNFFIEKDLDFKSVGIGRLSFFTDRIVFEPEDSEVIDLLISDIQTISPQLRERIELFYQGKAIRIVGEERGVSGVKWEIATNTIWRLTGERFKVSSYFNEKNEALLNQID